VSPAFDFSNCWPSKISFRMGGMIAAVGSVFLTPWNLFSNPTAIHYTVNELAAAIGPLYGILLADFYLVKGQKIDIRGLFSDRPGDTYWYKGGVNPVAVYAVVAGALVAIGTGFIGGDLNNFSLFIGGIIAAVIYVGLSRKTA
jgi:NCS1 family nucleobase:cation symporter-1